MLESVFSISFPTAIKKGFWRGTHRAVTPEETLRRVSPLLPAVGLTRVADITGLDCIGIPVAMAIRPNARSLAVSPGKGLDLLSAQTSAVMESLENWHAERILKPLMLAGLNEIRFAQRIVNLAGLPRRTGPKLDENARVLWIEGRELLSDAATWLPFELVHTNYTLPLPPSYGGLLASSNGLASGNHPLEALSHALCEVIERDAATLWHARDAAMRAATIIDPDTIDDSDCRALLARFAAAGVTVGIWDMTSDVGLAVFRVVIFDSDVHAQRSPLPGLGTGCHPVRAIALSRALTEAAQVRLTLISGSRDDMGLTHYATARSRATTAAIEAQLEMSGRRHYHAVPNFEGEALDDDVNHELQRLQSIGIVEVVAVDLTKPAIGIPVVRVVVPGLEGIHDAPGYLGGPRYQRQHQILRAGAT